jgi:hypothetical protein
MSLWSPFALGVSLPLPISSSFVFLALLHLVLLLSLDLRLESESNCLAGVASFPLELFQTPSQPQLLPISSIYIACRAMLSVAVPVHLGLYPL